jgi:acetyl-CoA carboxylase biotin carboxyl carrier protein
VSVRAAEAHTRLRQVELRSILPVKWFRIPGDEVGRAAESAVESALDAISAPTAGIFYRGSKPDSTPYVEEGATVQPESVVGLIEVMKTFEEVRAGVSGRIKEIQVEDGDVVTEGQSLMTVEPEGG